MAKTKISQFDANAANNTDLNSISIAEGTAPSNINNAIRELMSQLADLNLGNEVLSTLKIDNLHLDGNTIVTLDTNGDLNLTPNGTGAVTIAKVDINGGAIDGTPIGGSSASTGAFTTLSASSTANLGSSVTVSGGNIDGVIGANTPAAITGTVITANTNFAGNLTGNVTGTVDGVVGGTTPAAVTGTTITANTKFVGAIDGNVTATSGTSTFNNVTINGTLDMDSTTSQTITGLATPSGSTDAATKGYVDTEVSALVDSAPSTLNTLNELAAALGDDASFSTTVTNSIAAKLPLAGGTMTGDIDANSNTVSGLKAPSASNDATTKTYVDTADALKLNLSGGTLSGNLAMGSNKVTGLDTPTASGDATTKGYVDGILGSATAAATSASAAATSATSAATSATASASSATAAASSATSAAASYDSFDDRYLGAKSSAPTVDNDGDALVTGALYFNTSSNQLFIWSGSAWTQAAFTASGFLSGSNNLSDVDNAGTARTNLGLAIGTNVQAFDADLSALAGLTSAADKGIQFTGSGTAGTYDLTSAGKALLDDADAAAQRTTLGLGSAATLTAGTSANNAVQLDGSAKLPAVDGSQLTGLASGGTVNMVADGAISIRKPVVLTAAGKAKEVVETVSVASTPTSENNQSFDGNDYNSDVSIAYDTVNDKIGVFYRDDNNYGTIAIGSQSGTTITWGTPVVVVSASITAAGRASDRLAYGNGVFVATYVTSSQAKVRAGSYSGTNSITLGSELTPNSSNASGGRTSVSYNANAGKFIFAYSVDGTNSIGCWILSNSGTTLSVGQSTADLSISTAADDYDIEANDYDPDTNKTVLGVGRFTGNDLFKFYALTIDGTNLTAGSALDIDGTPTEDFSTYFVYDENVNKWLLLQSENNAGTYTLYGTVITASGTSLSKGTKTSLSSDKARFIAAYFDPDKNNIMIGYQLFESPYNGKLATISISGTTPSLTTLSEKLIDQTSSRVAPKSAIYNPDENAGIFVGTFDMSDEDGMAAVVKYTETTTSNLDNGNYLGIAAEAISDTATGKINVIGGTSTGHSSLTIGNHYFTNGAGTIGLVGNTTGEQYLGRAISATEIQLLENEGYLYGTAEGGVTAGKPVQVASDGDFEMIGSSTTNFTYAVGSEVEYLSDSIASHDVAYDTYRNKVILATHGTSAGTLRVYVGTVTGGSTNSISWGSAQDIYSKNGDFVKVAYDPVSYQTMIAWVNTSNGRIDAVVITEDGDGTITAGSVTTGLESSSAADRRHDLINVGERKWVLVYKDNSTNYMNSRVLTTTGTDITAQTETVIKSESTDRMAVAVNTEAMGGYAANTRLVYFRSNHAESDMKILGATLDGNSISNVGTEHDMQDAFQPNAGSAVYDPESNRFCCAARKVNVDGRFVSLVLDASNNSIGSVTESAFESGNTMAGLQVLAELGKVHICYGDRGDSTKGKIVDVTINSGTGAATYGTQNVFFTGVLNFTNSPIASGSDLGFAFDSDTNRFVAVYVDDATVDGQSVVGSLVGSKTISNIATDGESYIGIATKTVADDAQVEVATFGQIDAQQSGLTAGQKYFVQSDGSLGTSADSSVTTVAGKALSATKLLISQ